jgi:excinuclease ABC subunit C
LFLQRIRDEAHRFAISFHRRRRKKTSLQSELDTIAGVGKKRKAALLRHFKSVKNIRAADPAEIGALPGFNRSVAESILKALGNLN